MLKYVIDVKSIMGMGISNHFVVLCDTDEEEWKDVKSVKVTS